MVGFGGAGPLACVVAPFVSALVWSKQGWEVGENPVSISFKFLWTIFEPVLFCITGAQIKLYLLDGNIMLIGTELVNYLCKIVIGSLGDIRYCDVCKTKKRSSFCVSKKLRPMHF